MTAGTPTRAIYGMAVATLAVVLVWAGTAFACTPQPEVFSLGSESAAPGETVAVRGEGVGGEVEIRWNGIGGERLATAAPANGTFDVPVRVPQVAPGIYSLMLVTERNGVARTALQVVSPAGSAPGPRSGAGLWATTAAAPVASGSDVNALGLALLAVGLVGLFGGSTVAVARRRRALADIPA